MTRYTSGSGRHIKGVDARHVTFGRRLERNGMNPARYSI